MKKQLTRKEMVMQTAIRMVADGGFHASPMSELAAASGVAVGTIYHHFASKEDLIVALYARCLENRSKAVQSSLEGKASISKKFEAAWRSLFQHFLKNGEEFSFLDQYRHSPFISQLENESAAFDKGLNDFFKEGIKTGKLKKLNSEILSEVFYSLVSTALLLHKSTGKKKLATRDLDIMVEMSWSAVKK